MPRKLFFLILVLYTFNLNAQESNWAIQANFNPFFLGTINSETDHNLKSDGLSGGYNTGISLKYYLSDRWQLEGGVEYSKQIYNAKEFSAVEEGSDHRNELSFVKFPILVNYGWVWSHRNRTKLSFGVGGQVLVLNESYLKIEDRLQIITIEDGKRRLYTKDEDMVKNVIEADFFSKRRLGLIGQFGLEKQISDSFSYSIKLKTEYDLSLIDEDNDYDYNLSYFRIGLQFGIQYNFQKKPSNHIEGIL